MRRSACERGIALIAFCGFGVRSLSFTPSANLPLLAGCRLGKTEGLTPVLVRAIHAFPRARARHSWDLRLGVRSSVVHSVRKPSIPRRLPARGRPKV